MNKRAVKYIIGLVILVLLLSLLFRNRSPFGRNNTSFASDPGKEITKIEFLQGNKSLTLEKSGENWLLNGSGATRKSGILFIIRVLNEIQIKSPVSPGLFESEITSKKIEQVKVRVFGNRKLLNSFIVYKTSSNIYGNIMKKAAGSKPFIVYMPGFEGDIGSAFTLNELFWQPYTVFNLLPSEIASVDFENLTDTVNSFTIENVNSNYKFSDKNRNISGWDTALVTRYLSYFTRIPFESWVFNISDEEKKKIETTLPVYTIKVKTNPGKEITLTLWPRIIQTGDSAFVDTDRLFGKTETRDEFFLIRYFDIDPLLKKRSYFFPR